MKRFHIHVGVEDMEQSVRFYSKLFGSAPVKRQPDYAKWMLEDPRVNFAISRRGAHPGVDHVGFQVESADELAELRSRLQEADAAIVDQADTTCCYARSDKHWVTDPTGIAWETFHTLADVPTFNAQVQERAPSGARKPVPLNVRTESTGTCGAPGSSCC